MQLCLNRLIRYKKMFILNLFFDILLGYIDRYKNCLLPFLQIFKVKSFLISERIYRMSIYNHFLLIESYKLSRIFIWRFFMREMLNNKLPRFGLKIVYILHISSKLEKRKKLLTNCAIFLKQRKERRERIYGCKN